MYGQGNYGPQYGQGPNTPMPAFQHRPPGPPPPPPFQHNLPLPPPPTLQHPLPIPPHGIQPSLPMYPHATPAHGPTSQQGPNNQAQQNGMLTNGGQQYFRPPPPPPMHGGASMAHSYPFVPPGPPPLGRVVPLAPPQGQNMFRPPLLPPPPPPGGAQGLQHLPPPPPSSTSSFFTPSSFGSFVHSVALPPPPPPPPSSPPPLPPSPPPSSPPPPSSGDLPDSNSDLVSNKPSDSESRNESIDDLYMHDHHLNGGVGTRSEACDVVEGGSSFEKDVIVDLPPPPLPKPTEDNIESSIQTGTSINGDTTQSPADSDIDMEDDISEADKGLGDYQLQGLNRKPESIISEIDGTEQPLAPQSTGEGDSTRDVISENEPSYVSEDLAELGTGSNLSLKHNHSTAESPRTEVPIIVTSTVETEEYALETSKEKSTSPHMEDLSPPHASAAATVLGGSPFRLIQDYASDDSEENDDKPDLENVSQLIDSTKEDPGSTSPLADEAALATPLLVPDVSLESDGEEKSKAATFIEAKDTTPDEAFQKDEVLGGGDGVDSFSENVKQEKEEMKRSSAPLKVDEFGRLVREGGNDSDSDGSRYTGRMGKRGRSWSRSRSPHDRRRRRSPWGRKEKRSGSPSRSPQRRRSRSKSPSRRGGDFNSDKTRRDKGSLPACFDFLRGQCYRGASCRYLHHDSDKSDGSRRHKTKQLYVEGSPGSKTSDVHEKNKSVDEKKSDSVMDVNVKVLESSREVAIEVQPTQEVQEPVEEPVETINRVAENEHQKESVEIKGDDVQSLLEDPSSSAPSSETPLIQQPQADISVVEMEESPKPDSHPGQPLPSESQPLPSEPVILPPPPPLRQPMAVPLGSSFPHQVPFSNQYPHFPGPPQSSWTPPPLLPPPPPPPPMLQPPFVHDSLQFPQHHLPPRTDFHQPFAKPYHGALLPPLDEPHRLSQPLPGPRLMRDDRFHHPHDYSQSVQPFQNKIFPLPPQNFPSSSQSHPYSQHQLPPYGPPRYGSDLSEFRGTRISSSTHYNPYASTFEQPLSSKFSSNAFRQQLEAPFTGKYDSAFGSGNVPVDGLGREPRHISSPNYRAVDPVLARTSGDQYDPLFDSIEPTSSKKQEAASGSQKPIKEKKKKKESIMSPENDEYDETADAEVGAVENGSPGNPVDLENAAAGEIEIDEVKSPGKSKKSKDSRSMKLFRVALADFVKEVLKPSWRQGNMSKEAFKTIVKKTVDKVSGAMKAHQIPKSQAKINQYIDTSQRKLTKLVMGYVDKYVKV